MQVISVIAGALVMLGLSAQAQERRAVIFDIDGMLTPSVLAIDTVRDDAALAATHFADAGVAIIYLTARVPLFQDRVADWLDDNGFPPGQLYLTQTDADRDDHGAFKARVLATYAAEGWTFVAAFGDSSSDFAAYAEVGVPQQQVYALRRRGAWRCKEGAWQGCYDRWADLLPVIKATLVP